MNSEEGEEESEETGNSVERERERETMRRQPVVTVFLHMPVSLLGLP